MATARTNELPRGIRKRGSKYCVDVTVAGRRVTRTCNDLDEALVVKHQLKSGLEKGEQVGPKGTRKGSPWTVKKARETTIQVRWKGSKAERSATMNSERAVEFFGADTLLDDIDAEWLDQYVVWLEQRGNNAGGINRKLAALSTMFSVAITRGGAVARPKMPRQKEGKGRVRWVTDDEEQKMLTVLHQWGMDDVRDVILVLMDTGMRQGELWKVEERDLDLKHSRGRIHIWENKADHPRTIPMTTRVREIIERRLETHGARPFPYSGEWLRGPWARIKARLGLTEDQQFVPHVLRHTCASRLVQRGATIPMVQQWMGHKTIQMTMRYSHLAPTHLEDAASLLET